MVARQDEFQRISLSKGEATSLAAPFEHRFRGRRFNVSTDFQTKNSMHYALFLISLRLGLLGAQSRRTSKGKIIGSNVIDLKDKLRIHGLHQQSLEVEVVVASTEISP